MSDPWTWSAILAALFGGYFSALQLSLEDFTRSELETRLDRRIHSARVDWLMDHLDDITLACAVLRRLAAVVLMVSILTDVGLSRSNLSLQPIVIAAVGVFVWLWIVETGLAWAISDHVAEPVIAVSLRILPVIHYLTVPLTRPLNWLNEVVRRLAGGEEDRDDLEDELRQVMEESEREGHLKESEKEMIEAIVDFRTCTVGEIMTPRIDIDGLELTDDLSEIRQRVLEEGLSRFPVYVGSLDNIVGILYAKDLLPYVGENTGDFHLKPLLREVVIVPESRRISDLLLEFRERRVHMAIVLDEYGGTAGLVTIEDIVEEIVGEIRDEHDVHLLPEAQVRAIGNGAYEADGRLRIHDLNDELDAELPEDEDYDTVAGWVFASLGRIPKAKEVFRIEPFEVTVLEVDRTRLKRIALRRLDEVSAAAPESDSAAVSTQEEPSIARSAAGRNE